MICLLRVCSGMLLSWEQFAWSGGKIMGSDSLCNSNGQSRRSFLQLGAAAPAVLASGIVGESFLAGSPRAATLPHGPFPKDAVIIDADEHPLGRCAVARY